VNALRLRVAALLERLSPRERALLGGAVLATLAIVIWLCAATLADRREALAAQIAAGRRDLERMVTLRDEVLRLRAENDAVQRRLASLGAEFSLFSHLEAVTRRTLSRERITAMNPSTRPLTDGMQEESVAIRLSGVSLRELVSLLYEIEKGEAPLLVGQLRVKKRYDESQIFDVTLDVVRLRTATAS
jgi:type II secretory pathway component PulM